MSCLPGHTLQCEFLIHSNNYILFFHVSDATFTRHKKANFQTLSCTCLKRGAAMIFLQRHHHVCPQERKRTPKGLRASRSVTTAKIHTQRPGRAKTVAREREPLRLRRLHRTVCFARLLRTSRKTGRTYTLRGRNGEGSEGEPRREKGPEGGPLV